MRTLGFRFLIISLVYALSAPVAAGDVVLHRFVLENKLRVVVVPDHSAPVITHMLLVEAGAADDELGSSGVAHYLEHMLFKGTPAVPEGEYSTQLEALGAEYNAFTNADMTGYYVTIAAQSIAKVMELEADRMQNLAPTPESYAKERDVVMEERRLRTDNNPSALLYEAMNAAIFRHHPYHTPIIGWAHEIAQLDELSAQAFLRKHYSPANMVLLLVGDIAPDKAKALAEKYYGKWHGSPKAARRWVSEPPRQVSQTVTLHHENVTLPRVIYSYIAPSIATSTNANQVMPLILAEELLGNARNGIFYRELVEKQKLATSVSVSYDAFNRGPSQFRIALTPSEHTSLETLDKAYKTLLAKILTTDIDDKALQRSRNQLKASTIFARDSVEGMAFIFAQLLMIGADTDYFNRWAEYVDNVTEPQIIAALKDTLTENTAVTGYLLPPIKSDTQESTDEVKP